MALKVGWRTGAAWEYRPQMLHGLQQWLTLPAHGGCQLPAKPRSHPIQPTLQPTAQPINRFQGKRQPQFFNGGFDRQPGQQLHQPPPHQRRPQRVARQYIGQDKGKGPATTAAPPAIGAKHPLASDGPPAGLRRIVAAKDAVPVQGFNFSAAGAALLLE
jgi:hypothetical protein